MPNRSGLPKFQKGQRSISAQRLNDLAEMVKDHDRSSIRKYTRPVQTLIVAQEQIASGEIGEVKYAFWDVDGAAFEVRGDAFEALNIGPEAIPSSGRAVLSIGERQLPFFQYGTGGGGGGSVNIFTNVGSHEYNSLTADESWHTLDISGTVGNTAGAVLFSVVSLGDYGSGWRDYLGTETGDDALWANGGQNNIVVCPYTFGKIDYKLDYDDTVSIYIKGYWESPGTVY